MSSQPILKKIRFHGQLRLRSSGASRQHYLPLYLYLDHNKCLCKYIILASLRNLHSCDKKRHVLFLEGLGPRARIPRGSFVSKNSKNKKTPQNGVVVNAIPLVLIMHEPTVSPATSDASLPPSGSSTLGTSSSNESLDDPLNSIYLLYSLSIDDG